MRGQARPAGQNAGMSSGARAPFSPPITFILSAGSKQVAPMIVTTAVKPQTNSGVIISHTQHDFVSGDGHEGRDLAPDRPGKFGLELMIMPVDGFVQQWTF
jgi:hypothetical protein